MTPAKIYPFSIPAGGSFPLLVIGDYCKILTSSGPLEIDGDSFGTIGPILAGQGVQDAPFRRLVLNDRSGATNNGTILIADQAFIDDRITGEVSIIDGEKAQTLSRKAFLATGGTALIAAQQGHLQLFNPAGTGKNLIVESLMATTTASGNIWIGINTAAIGTQSPIGASYNKLANAQASVGFLGTLNNAGRIAPPTPNLSFQMTGNTLQIFNFKKPFVLTPGTGLVMVNNTNGSDISGAFEFYEEAIL